MEKLSFGTVRFGMLGHWFGSSRRCLSVTATPHRKCLVRLVSLKWAVNCWSTCLSPHRLDRIHADYHSYLIVLVFANPFVSLL